MKVPNTKLKTAKQAEVKLMPLHQKIATGLKPQRPKISGKNK